MVLCPSCNACDWQYIHRSPINPDEDKFKCNKCGKSFRRYDSDNQWREFWKSVEPGTMFIKNGNMYRMLAPSSRHHTDECLVDSDRGTIHHYSELFLLEDGIEEVKACIVSKAV